LQFRVEGPCLKANQPGIIVSYNLPHLLLDTVKIPGDSDLTDLSLPGVAGPGFLGGGGALGNTGEWNLQYTEAHIVQYPLQLAIQLGVIPIPEKYFCPEQMRFGPIPPIIHYVSELDLAPWRLLAKERGGGRLGVWATLYPRGGFVIHHSPSVASVTCGVRGVDIAANPGIHHILVPLWFVPNFAEDLVQQADPQVSRCLTIGENPLRWDHHMGALNGKYVWVYWHRIACCVAL
jgi:hypothetical protein